MQLKMESAQVQMKRIGYSNCTLIVNGNNSILIDTGVRGFVKQIIRMFKKNGLSPGDIKLIILTHSHYDHTGNLHKLKHFTGAKVLVHRNEFENLKNGRIHIPDGQRYLMKLLSQLGKLIVPGFASPKPFTADIVNEDEYDLSEYGVDGKIISTPGHSPGSQSVILGKKIIAGDCFMNMNYGVVFPHFAENPQLLLNSWKKIFNNGIVEIYPGHGKILAKEKAYRVYMKWKKKLNVD